MSFADQPYLGRDVDTQHVVGSNVCIDKHYEVTDIIGRGAYSTVFGGIDLRTGHKVAIKKIKESIFCDEINTKRILREINILRQIRHESVIEMIDLVPPENRENFTECYIVLKRMTMDLRRVIHSKTKLLHSHVVYLGYQIFRTLKYLHSIGVVHRDLTPANILVGKGCDIKICDFGLSRKISRGMTMHVVTRWYRAPEIMCWDNYDTPVDIWAAACIVAELYRRKPLFPGKQVVHQLNMIFELLGRPSEDEQKKVGESDVLFVLLADRQKKPLEEYFVNADVSEEGMDLLKKLLVFDPDKRLAASEVLAHPFFCEWHDPNDEPIGDRLIETNFEDIEDIEQIKDLLWQEFIEMQKKIYKQEHKNIQGKEMADIVEAAL